jgi:3-dehydroquinate synthase
MRRLRRAFATGRHHSILPRMSDLRLRFPGPTATTQVRVRRGGLDGLGGFVRRLAGARRVVVISDARVARLHAPRALRSLRRSGCAVRLVRIPVGERSKSPQRLAGLWAVFADSGLDRADAVIALGGGVTGDLAGFAAATYLRGLPWFAVPTSLLAQVDSAIGGKTAVDLPVGKNLVGAFHQPLGVLVDPALLATLPVRHRRAGLAEVVKTALAVDRALFDWVERNALALAAGDPAALAGAVARSIRAKARVVQADEREREGGGRTALNLGHTTAHALEALTGYRRLLHGEAVALGLRVSTAISVRECGLRVEDRIRLEALLDLFGLPARLPAVASAHIVEAMQADKKRRGGRVRWILTPQVGHASVPRLISGRLVRSALREYGSAE